MVGESGMTEASALSNFSGMLVANFPPIPKRSPLYAITLNLSADASILLTFLRRFYQSATSLHTVPDRRLALKAQWSIGTLVGLSSTKQTRC